MLDKILEYQTLDTQIKAIELELSSTEERKRTRALLQFLKETEEKLKKMEQYVSEIAFKYNSYKEQYDTNSNLLKEYTDAVNNVMDEDELNYIRKKYEDLVHIIANLEKEIVAIMQEANNVSKQFDECRAKLPSAKKQLEEAKKKFEEIRKQKEPEISAIQSKQSELEKVIPKEVLTLYKELRDQKISRPLFS